MASAKRIKIEEEFGIDQFTLSIDSEKIGQVLNNLVGNAIKYSNPNSIITVSLYIKNDHVLTEVKDQGIGIKASEIDRIFHPFERTSSQPTSNESSHGLGLAIVKKIIEGHDGTVGVKSVCGKGSTFYFTLPI